MISTIEPEYNFKKLEFLFLLSFSHKMSKYPVHKHPKQLGMIEILIKIIINSELQQHCIKF